MSSFFFYFRRMKEINRYFGKINAWHSSGIMDNMMQECGRRSFRSNIIFLFFYVVIFIGGEMNDNEKEKKINSDFHIVAFVELHSFLWIWNSVPSETHCLVTNLFLIAMIIDSNFVSRWIYVRCQMWNVTDSPLILFLFYLFLDFFLLAIFEALEILHFILLFTKREFQCGSMSQSDWPPFEPKFCFFFRFPSVRDFRTEQTHFR